MYLWTEPVPIAGQWWPWIDWLRVVLEHMMNFLIRCVMYIGLATVTLYTLWQGKSETIRVRDDGE